VACAGCAQALQIDFGATRDSNGVKLRWLRGDVRPTTT